MLRRARIVLGYDGTSFLGSQTQPRVRTVQSELQRAIERVSPGAGACVLAGRTDRGVHAHGQVASVDVRWSRSERELRYSLDAVSPPDVIIRSVEWVGPEFHARFDARSREYRYRIVVSSEPPVLEARFAWWRRSAIDDTLAQQASALLVGTHAFGAFAGHGWSRSRDRDELVRVVDRCEWRRADRWDEDGHWTEYEFRVSANGFLPNMVRNMVTAVVAVGSGNQPLGWVNALLQDGDRQALGEAAPPHGLALWRVTYDYQDEQRADDRPDGECEVH